MPKAPFSDVLQYLRKVCAAQSARDLSDRQLLNRFIVQHEDAAFTVLVQRHGPMVLGVCQRVLGDVHQAEDCLQATFMVLVRRAASLRLKASLATWLYAVAQRVAVKARAQGLARRQRERRYEPMPQREFLDELTWQELRGVLDEEIAKLPEKYQAPLVLCYLEGKTQEQAAKELGWPKNALPRRIEPARELLRQRLVRRGVSLSAGVLATALCEKVSGAPVGAMLVIKTVKAAASLAAGKAIAAGCLSAQAIAMAEEAVAGLVGIKGKLIVTMLVLGLGIGGAGVAGYAGLGDGKQPAESRKAQTPPAKFDMAGPEKIGAPVPAENKAPPQDPVLHVGPAAGADAGAKPTADAAKPICSLAGHTDRVTSVAYSPDGKSIATAAWDGSVRLWDAQTGKEVQRLDVPAPRDYNPAHLYRILFSPDNKFVVAAQGASPKEPGVMVWKRRTGEKVHQFPGGTGSVAVSPDGRLIACGGYGVVRLYELDTGKVVRELHGQQERIESLTFSPDGKALVSTGPLPRPDRGDGVERGGLMPAVIRVWDVATGKEHPSTLKKLELGGLGQCLALSPDGKTLAVANSLWEIATGGCRARLTGHTQEICGIAFSPDGRTFASGSMDGTVRLWDLPFGKEIGCLGKEVERFKGGWVLAVEFSPDGRSLVSGGLNKTADIWDLSQITGRKGKPAERSPAELEADWKDLAGDAATGYAALGRLVSSPERAVAFLGKQLQSAEPLDIKRIERLIADLDDKQFKIRQQATNELKALGDLAEPALQKALAGKPSLEVRQRLEALLDRLDGVSPLPETVRQIRAVEALELIGNSEARRLLHLLAAGPPETRLTLEAKAAAGRLAK